MTIETFKEHNVVYAKDQPEYLPLPCRKYSDPQGTLICCWRMSWRERLKILWTGLIWHEILTFNKPLQPQLLTVDKPNMKGSK